jgi:hypothetical protein
MECNVFIAKWECGRKFGDIKVNKRKDRIMKKFFGCAVVIATLSACGGETGQREYEMKDNAVEAPTSSPQTNTMTMDTSTYGVQDSTTTVGWDTSAKRKN